MAGPATRKLRSFGIEEEFLLLDRDSGVPCDRAAAVIGAMPEIQLQAEREFLASQLETATDVCHTAEQAESSLQEFRVRAARVAEQQKITLASSGLPAIGGEIEGTVTPKPRYRAIYATMRSAAAHQYSTGTHVHVEVPSRDVGVQVLGRMARWTPTLLALTANSPLWMGEVTGFASWRHIMGLAWPLSGYAPNFSSAVEYDNVIRGLIATGVILDSGMVTWTARLSERYPTVEFRIADAQLTAQDSVAFGVLLRALVDQCVDECDAGQEHSPLHLSLVNGANWVAARDGLESELIDPLTGVHWPAHQLVQHMVDSVEGELVKAGDYERVMQYVERRKREGSPAQIQLRKFAEGGIAGLLEIYRAGTGTPTGGLAGATIG